jgi:hypothetical protein
VEGTCASVCIGVCEISALSAMSQLN